VRTGHVVVWIVTAHPRARPTTWRPVPSGTTAPASGPATTCISSSGRTPCTHGHLLVDRHDGPVQQGWRADLGVGCHVSTGHRHRRLAACDEGTIPAPDCRGGASTARRRSGAPGRGASPPDVHEQIGPAAGAAVAHCKAQLHRHLLARRPTS
jgi:hypothetical protein